MATLFRQCDILSFFFITKWNPPLGLEELYKYEPEKIEIMTTQIILIYITSGRMTQ